MAGFTKATVLVGHALLHRVLADACAEACVRLLVAYAPQAPLTGRKTWVAGSGGIAGFALGSLLERRRGQVANRLTPPLGDAADGDAKTFLNQLKL